MYIMCQNKPLSAPFLTINVNHLIYKNAQKQPITAKSLKMGIFADLQLSGDVKAFAVLKFDGFDGFAHFAKFIDRFSANQLHTLPGFIARRK